MTGRVLVTGSEGFTGKYVCEALRASGWDVWGAGLGAKFHKHQYLQIDLLKPDSLAIINDTVNPDAVIHLAASSFIAANNSTAFYQVNLIGTKNLLDILSQARTPPRNTILASSASVYGEHASGAIEEEYLTQPTNHYGVSKLAMEHLASTYQSALDITITRPFNYTGVGQEERFLIPKIVKHFQLEKKSIELGNIAVSRDFSDVRDVAAVYAKLATEKPVEGPVNLCSGVSTSLQSVISAMKRISGLDIQIEVNTALLRDGDVLMMRGDRTKLGRLVKVQTRSLEETLAWMYYEARS